MKKQTVGRFILMSVLTTISWALQPLYAGNGTGSLALDKWQFSQYGTEEWLDATVPGTVHQDLMAHDRLPDPFYGMNEQKIQWVEKEDWLYRTSFVLSQEQLDSDDVTLVFKGLDTYADVYLNGALVLKADNMFVGYRIPVKPVLRSGENRLVVRFRSPIRETMPQWASNGFDYPADNDHYPQKLSVFSRKAPYSYGWDWGIRMVTCGIWRPVRLEFAEGASLEDFFVCQKALSSELAKVENQLEVRNVSGKDLQAEVKVTYRCGSQSGETARTVVLTPGNNCLTLPMDIRQPRLWMPNGWGEPVRYEFRATVSVGGRVVAARQHRIGLRTVRLVREKDEAGMSFYFEVNGIPMFAKGANVIPSDALLPRVTSERYARLLEDVQRSNMNLLRVWGGGIYEDDRFYEEADKRGILIWQDLVFACTTYPHDPAFMKRVAEEVEYNARRLRNHPSLALWCGNNEIYEGIRYWGWRSKYTPEIYGEMEVGYDTLFRKRLPELIARFDPGRDYLEGSPYEANWGRPESWGTGDSHNWGTWYGKKPFESLDTEIPRFMSEFGFQAFPEMKTLRTFAAPEDYDLESPVMNAHQKSTIGNALIRQTMERYYRVPEQFDDLVYVGLVLQGWGMRHGVEAHRRNRPYCMGSLPWQLNDSWPVVSWSSIDYYGNWKAMQYQLQRAFAPVVLDARKEDGKFRCYVLSDCLSPEEVELQLELADFSGKVYRRWQQEGTLPVNASALFYEGDWNAVFEGCDPAASFVRLTLKKRNGEACVATRFFYPVYPKDQHLPATEISAEARKIDDCNWEIELSASQLARDVFIEIPVQGARFSDNFFDLLPGETRKITVTLPEAAPAGKLDMRIRHLGQTAG